MDIDRLFNVFNNIQTCFSNNWTNDSWVLTGYWSFIRYVYWPPNLSGNMVKYHLWRWVRKRKKSLGDSQSQSRVINDWGWWACKWTNTYSWISSTIQGVRGWEKHWWPFNMQVVLRIEIKVFYTWNPTLSFLIKRPLFSLKLVHSIISRGDVTLLCGLKPLLASKLKTKLTTFTFYHSCFYNHIFVR